MEPQPTITSPKRWRLRFVLLMIGAALLVGAAAGERWGAAAGLVVAVCVVLPLVVRWRRS
jgi:hypothetical protein